MLFSAKPKTRLHTGFQTDRPGVSPGHFARAFRPGISPGHPLKDRRRKWDILRGLPCCACAPFPWRLRNVQPYPMALSASTPPVQSSPIHRRRKKRPDKAFAAAAYCRRFVSTEQYRQCAVERRKRRLAAERDTAAGKKAPRGCRSAVLGLMPSYGAFSGAVPAAAFPEECVLQKAAVVVYSF